ncbi:MAG: hypothetical protein ACRDD8_08375 [Bacteroidales bacterium]
MKRLFSYILLLIFCSSCTYDYFEDETNYRLYIPQIHDKSISDFHVSFFDMSGNRVFEKEYAYPFDGDMFIEQGIIRAKLLPGEYRISCFANTKDAENEVFFNKALTINTSDVWLSKVTDGVYNTASELRAVLNKETTAPFIGQPMKIDTIDISDETAHVGQIIYQFKKLPVSVDRIEVATVNITTGVSFDGLLLNASDSDCVFQNLKRESLINDNGLLSVTSYYFPSALSDLKGSDRKTLGVQTRFFDAKNNLVGEYLDPLPKATDKDGNRIDPILLSGKKLWITFEGFIIADIVLSDWGDIIGGEVTPM